MADPRYQTDRRDLLGLSITQCVLAVSVIAGLTFVTMRLMNGGLPATWRQSAGVSTMQAKAEAPPIAQNEAISKLP